MNITVRLYKLHDYDLIYLYKNLRFPIRDAMKLALESYVRNTPLFLKIPINTPEIENLKDIKNAQFHLKLDEDKDADIILYLSRLKKYYRNSFLKNLLRGYLAGPATYVYEENIDVVNNQKRYQLVEDNLLSVKTLEFLKKRKRKKDHIILTLDQKRLFELAGALDGNDLEVIINDRNPIKNQ